MNQIITMRHVETTIENAGWIAEHAPEKQEPFILSLNKEGSEKVILDGIGLSALNERDALTEKVIKHDLMDDFGNTVESKSVIPFGVEPMLSRKFEYYLKTIRVTTDVVLRKNSTISNFNVDDLRLTGDWLRFAVVSPDANGDFPDSIPWCEITTEASTLWEGGEVFAFILLENANGTRLEIGTGFDMWRWNVAATMGATGKFTLEKKENGEIVLKRSVLQFDSETEIPGREWRFHWYLSWSYGEDDKRVNRSQSGIKTFPQPGAKPERGGEKENNLIFTLKETPWSEPARISRNAKPAPFPCFHSKTVRNHIRKTIRSIAANAEESLETLSILDCAPHFCDSRAHLERAKQEYIPHWDITDIIAFHFWASRKLKDKEIIFKIFPPSKGIFNELPSFTSMREPDGD